MSDFTIALCILAVAIIIALGLATFSVVYEAKRSRAIAVFSAAIIDLFIFYGLLFFAGYGKIAWLMVNTETVYEVAEFPDGPGLRTVKFHGWGPSYMVNFDCAKIRGGCEKIPPRGVPFKLVRGNDFNDLQIVLMDIAGFSDAAKSKQK